MANYANLKATINANIKANGTEAITGPVLNSVLTAAVNTLGAGYQFMGVATTSTNPGTPDANVFYIAATPGTYTNFGGKTVADGEVAILKYNGTWTKEVTGAATAAQLTQLGQELPLNLINKGVVSEWDGNSAVTNRFVSLIQGHTYKFVLSFQNSGVLGANANVKLMSGDSLSSVKKIIDLANKSITSGDIITADLLWTDASVENYRLGVYDISTKFSIYAGAVINVRDITAEKATEDSSANKNRLVPIAPIGFISTHETDKIAITDTTITIPKNTRIVYGLNGYSYTATQTSQTVINRDSNFEQLIVFNIGTKTIVGRMINAVQTNDVILFMVQNNTDNKRKISLHPSLYTYDGKSPFATDADIITEINGVRAENNATYPFKSGGVPSIPSSSVTYTAISGVTLVNGHNYRVKLIADSTFTAPSDLNLKIMTADSDSTLYRVFQMGGTSVSSLSTDFVWEEQTAENYRLGFFGSGAINVGISVYIEDITIDSVSGINWGVISRNKHKEASLVSTVSHRGNDAIKVADKLSLLHFSDVHGNTDNIADVVEYMTHYADFLEDAIHTGDSVLTKMSDTNPFVSVEGAENILNVIGNHEAWLDTSDPDYYATEKQTYDKIFAPSIANWDVVQPTGAAENGYCYYYKDYSTAGFRLIVLDSVHWHYRNGVTDSNPTQKAWFESVLADARTNNLRVVCAMHYPPQNGLVPVANDTGWNAPILSDSGGLVGDGWYASDEIFDCVDAFITAGGKFNGWIMGHTHEDFFGKVLGHTSQPIVVIGTANGSGYIYDKFVTGTVAQDNFNIITFENLNSKDYIKVVKMGGDCDVLMRSKKTICYNVTDGVLVSTT